MPACSGRKCPSSFEEGGRFVSSPRRRHRRGHSLSVHLASPVRASPVRASPTHAVPAPLPPPVTPTLPRLPRCRRLSLLPFLVYPAAATCHSYPHLVYPAAACHSYPHLVYPAAADFGYRSAARTATLPAWSEMPPRPVFLQLFYGTSHSRSPSLLCPEHKKADGTAQRSVRRQKATNLSRQHHRGSSSTRQVSARA